MSNRLQGERSPYLLQHAGNPVDWYPWGEEAFARAEREDKPVFLSIGYSTCHWCHVMAHESFESPEIAEKLNTSFISIKVDREERPDVDSVYMAACQAMTGSGGWPTSLFLTPEKKPFFAGTYFPPHSRGRWIGFAELLDVIAGRWRTDRASLLGTADRMTEWLRAAGHESAPAVGGDLPQAAFRQLSAAFDAANGGFGSAPKFPSPHCLLFLLCYAGLRERPAAAYMAIQTLTQMRRGGIFDQIGGGFSRYSTDARFLVPHFEKMLSDNALLIWACAAAYRYSRQEVLLDTAVRTAGYVLREMTSPDGGFYTAQDADSEGGEGTYYLFGYNEILEVLGQQAGKRFCECFGVSEAGNFEGKNILHQLDRAVDTERFSEERSTLYEYRRRRMPLHTDDQILTGWNGMMIAALTVLYRVSGNAEYLDAARRADDFLQTHLFEGERLYASYRDGRHSPQGFLDDYACYAAALLTLYSAVGEKEYLYRAEALCQAAMESFAADGGGFSMIGRGNEKLLFAPRECYDGAGPSGNAMMAFVLVRLSQLSEKPEHWREPAERQLAFLSREAAAYPAGHCMFLLSLLLSENPPPQITVVCARPEEAGRIPADLPLDADLRVLTGPEPAYPLLNGKTTYYVCRTNGCRPATNLPPDTAGAGISGC